MKQVSLPDWLKKRYSPADDTKINETRILLANLSLNTVCQSAICPNIHECFFKKTAAFMIMGNICTRNCCFCAVTNGRPLSLDPDEPARIAQAVVQLDLKHVVVTSVTRDDLSDGGSTHFADTVKAITHLLKNISVEVLTPDFNGNELSISKVVEAGPKIFNHNIETIPRLYPTVRPQADYSRSLEVLRVSKKIEASIYTKSGLMVGLGETEYEVRQVMEDLRSVECDILTIGQYLSPSLNHLKVSAFVHPEMFVRYQDEAKKIGFKHIESGPFVRSSYNADKFFKRSSNNADK